MEDTKVLISTTWQQRLRNEKYKNWLKVGDALSGTCNGIRSYIEREAKAFHAALTSALHGLPFCTCVHAPSRRPNPYHDIRVCSWAKELKKYHVKRRPTWAQSDASRWNDPNVGYWEVAKLFMPYGCNKGNSCADTDATGLLNLLCMCSYYKTDATVAGRVRDTRNDWAHAATKELNAAKTTDAFTAMKDFLQDAELTGDADAINALNEITALENDDVIDFEDLETKVVRELKQSMECLKDELDTKLESIKHQEDLQAEEIKEKLSHVKSMLSYCMRVENERDAVLFNIQTGIATIIYLINGPSIIRRKLLQGLLYLFKGIVALAIMGYLTMPKGIPRVAIMIILVMTGVTILDENLEEFGCTRNAFYNPFKFKEIDFIENLNRAREGFVGRQWLFKEISNSLDQEEHKGVLIIAAPGFGKSALMSNLICSKLSSFSLHSQILGYHLCIHSHKKTQNGAVFVRNLANMIAGRLQDYESLIKSDHFIQKILKKDECSSDPSGCFEQGILTPLSRLPLRFLKKMYIVVDALDECFNENEGEKETSIVNILSNNIKMFPIWLKIIVTSRNVTNIRRKFSSLNIIELQPDNPRNLQDIESFILLQLQMKNVFVEDLSIQAMVNKSQGNFLYIKLVLEYLKNKAVSEASWNSLPTSINSVYQEFFERKFNTTKTFEDPRKIFEILVATLSPLTTEELYDVFLTKHKNSEEFHFEYDFMFALEELSMYLSSIQENQIVTVFHNSLTEWLTSTSNKGGRFYVDPKEGNRMLADYYFKRISDKSINITTQLVYDLATYVVQGRLLRHKERFEDFSPEIIKTSDHHSNFSALHLAATSNDKNILKILLNFFEDVDCKESNGRTPAFFAVTSGNLDNLRLLHNKGASLFYVTKMFPLPMKEKDNFDEIKDCKVQMCGYTLLHVAAQKGHVDVVEFLLDNKVNISSLSGTGSSAIHLASEYGHVGTLEVLLEHGAVADDMCLYYAALHGKADAVRLLLQNGVKDSCIDCSNTNHEHSRTSYRLIYDNYMRYCNTALHAAAIGDYPEVIDVLLTSSYEALKCTNYYGRDPLHEAVQNDNYKAAKVLLDFKANSSSICKFVPSNSLIHGQQSCPCGYTPLHSAAHHGFGAMTHLLLEHKADYNATDCEGLQPIHVAACRGNSNILSILFENGVDVNSKSFKNMTPMHYACKCHAEKVYETLFELGADGFAKSKNTKTPVHYLFDGRIIDKEYFFVDPYVDKPIDPIDDESASRAPGLHKFKDTWVRSFAKYLESFITLTSNFPEKIRHLNQLFLFNEKFWVKANFTEFLIDLFGSSAFSNASQILYIPSPLIPFIIDMASGPLFQRHYLDKLRTKSALPSIFKKVIKNIFLNVDCSKLLHFIKFNLVYAADAMIDIGTDVNCKDESGLSPLLVYLRQGGRNIAKVLVKHQVIVDIQCREHFEDSVFHLAAYHKLHYLQYISLFRDPVKWGKYLQEENALFDYLFDEYDKVTVGEQVKVVRVRDGPVTKAIKSHPRGYKIIDECLDRKGYTALHRAAQGGNVVAVKHFLNWGADARKESPEGFDALTLAIWYSVKYRPKLNLHKPGLLTSLEIEFASLTAGVILRSLTRIIVFDVGCDQKKSSLTLLHLAATRGMWRFIDELFLARDNFKVTGLTANCPTNDNITPMYLAKLYGGDDCDWDNPWCKVVGILLNYGASMMIYPDKTTEYHVIFNAIFQGFPEKLNNDVSLIDMMNLRDTCGHEECLQFQHGPAKDSNLIKELQQGSPQTKRGSCSLENVLQDVARQITSKENELAIIKNDYLNFVSRSIDAIEHLVVAGIIRDNEKLGVCKPNKMKTTMKSVTPSNIDMCSEQTTLHIKEVKALLRKKYRAYINAHHSLKKELEHIRKILKAKEIEPERYKDLNRACYLFERNSLCEWQTLTIKYVRLKFLLHVLDSWQQQVKRNGKYPSMSPFATKRIEEIFLACSSREMIELMIKLSKENPSEDYEYLEMLKFLKPPMFDDFHMPQ